jgi:hypothetical protein
MACDVLMYLFSSFIYLFVDHALRSKDGSLRLRVRGETMGLIMIQYELTEIPLRFYDLAIPLSPPGAPVNPRRSVIVVIHGWHPRSTRGPLSAGFHQPRSMVFFSSHPHYPHRSTGCCEWL